MSSPHCSPRLFYSPASSSNLSLISLPPRSYSAPSHPSPESPYETPSVEVPPNTPNLEYAPEYYCSNCNPLFASNYEHRPVSPMGRAKGGSPHRFSAIIKPGQLAHPLPPTASSDTESCCCISAQSVTSTLLSNPTSAGNFIIFRRKTRISKAATPAHSPRVTPPTARGVASPADASIPRTSSPLNPAAVSPQSNGITALLNNNSIQLSYDVISGHAFELTTRGSVLYRDRERASESAFANTWASDKGNLQKVERLVDSTSEFRFALFGPGNHTSFMRTFSQCNGKGSWRRLLGEIDDDEGREGKPTHIVFMELPEVVAQMVALGVKPSEVVHCLKQGEYGTLRLDFLPGEWTSPEEREGGHKERDGNDQKDWKRGWWVTARKGMGVWVS